MPNPQYGIVMPHIICLSVVFCCCTIHKIVVCGVTISYSEMKSWVILVRWSIRSLKDFPLASVAVWCDGSKPPQRSMTLVFELLFKYIEASNTSGFITSQGGRVDAVGERGKKRLMLCAANSIKHHPSKLIWKLRVRNQYKVCEKINPSG